MIRFLTLAVISVAITTSAMASTITLTGTHTIDGATTGTDPGPFDLTSTDSTYSILRFIPNESVTFADLTNVNIDYNMILGGIREGAPRLVFVFSDSTDLTANFGPAGTFADLTLGVGNSGNLISMTDTGRYDNTDVGGGFYSTYAEALSLAGSKTIIRFSLVVDSYDGHDREFTVPVDGFHIEANSSVPEPMSLSLVGVGLVGLGFLRHKLKA